MWWLGLFVCATFCANADSTRAPFITPCHASDDECHRRSAQNAVPIIASGVPSLGISALDPMRVDRVTANEAGLRMTFTDTIVKGLRNCQILNLKRRGRHTNVDLKCSIIMVGNYNLGGKLLVLPIQGNGKYKIKIRDIIVKIVFDVGEKMMNGERYWQVLNWRHTADVQTGVDFQFQNLFNGNKQLSDNIHEFANSNWRDIFQEVAPPIVRAVVSQVVEQVTKLFDEVPVRELSLD